MKIVLILSLIILINGKQNNCNDLCQKCNNGVCQECKSGYYLKDNLCLKNCIL